MSAAPEVPVPKSWTCATGDVGLISRPTETVKAVGVVRPSPDARQDLGRCLSSLSWNTAASVILAMSSSTSSLCSLWPQPNLADRPGDLRETFCNFSSVEAVRDSAARAEGVSLVRQGLAGMIVPKRKIWLGC